MAFKPNFQPSPKKTVSTELGLQQIVSKFCHENDFAKSPENTKVFREGIEREHDGVWTVENLRAVMKQHRTKLTRAITIKTLPRTVSPEEVMAMAQQVLAANPWIDSSSEKNGKMIAEIFSDDPRMSPKRNLADMVKAVEICKDKLERTPPPPPPSAPQYEEGSLEDWQLPYPQADWQLRRASREQVSDYVARLRKREAWEAQQKESRAT